MMRYWRRFFVKVIYCWTAGGFTFHIQVGKPSVLTNEVVIRILHTNDTTFELPRFLSNTNSGLYIMKWKIKIVMLQHKSKTICFQNWMKIIQWTYIKCFLIKCDCTYMRVSSKKPISTVVSFSQLQIRVHCEVWFLQADNKIRFIVYCVYFLLLIVL